MNSTAEGDAVSRVVGGVVDAAAVNGGGLRNVAGQDQRVRTSVTSHVRTSNGAYGGDVVITPTTKSGGIGGFASDVESVVTSVALKKAAA